MSHDEMEAFLADIIAGLRAESSALVTVGGAATFWACAWRYLDLDFYQFHIYDWVDEWRPFESSPSDFGIFDKPAIIGEFPLQGLQRAGTAELLDTWYQNGWAGALGWAVTERGSGWNESQADLRAFATQHPCQTHY